MGKRAAAFIVGLACALVVIDGAPVFRVRFELPAWQIDVIQIVCAGIFLYVVGREVYAQASRERQTSTQRKKPRLSPIAGVSLLTVALAAALFFARSR